MFAWEPHNDLCDLCLVVGGESSGGRPKRKRKGRPRDDEPTHFRGEKSLEELVTLTHQNLPLSHLFSFPLLIRMISAVTTATALLISQ